ncbi:MAG: DUF6029 family protein [candidate division WOR-3 bacterium]
MPRRRTTRNIGSQEPEAKNQKSRPVLLLCVLCAVLCVLSSRAAEFTIQGVNRAEFWAFQENWATQIEDKLDLVLRYGDLRGQLGLFLYDPSRPWDAVRKPLRLADFTAAYSPRQLEILYGKFFQTFGKGLTLRAYNDEEFRHYKSLHGLRGSFQLPVSTELVAFGARLRDVFFQENAYKIMNAADTSDQVLGADLSSQPIVWQGSDWTRGNFGFGGRYVRINRSADPTAKAFTELFGGNTSTAVGPVELYGEACWRLGTRPGIGGRDRGFGYYGSATLLLAGYSIIGQIMDYDKLGFPTGVYHYNDPPTPILSGVALDRGIDERGFGLTVNGSPLTQLYFEGNYGRLFRHDDSSAGVLEWQGKARYSFGSDWTFEGSFDHMLQKNVELGTYERTVDKPVAHVNYLWGQHTFGLEAEYAFVRERPSDTTQAAGPYPWKYHESAIALSYGHSEALQFTLGWQRVDKKLAKRYNDETSWPILEAVWNVTQRNMLRIRLGAERGGYTCSGGVCRFEAPFRGLKVQFISRF